MKHLSLIFILLVTYVSVASAQDVPLEDKVETTQPIAEAAVQNQLSAAEKLKDPMFLRAQQLHKKQAAYLSAYKTGEVRPFPEIVENWQSYKDQLEALRKIEKQWKLTENTKDYQRLQNQLLDQLQPIGPFLRSADHKGLLPNILSKNQQKQQKELDEAYNVLKSDKTGDRLELKSSPNPYTLKFLPIPIHFTAPAGSEIILHSATAGLFANKLSKIRLITDKNGQATTTWVSVGDAVADCSIHYRSNQYTGVGHIHPNVKQLNLMPLESLSPVAKQAQSKVSQ